VATEVTPLGAELPSSRQSGAKSADWFGQPRGLTILFLTDMWEQFSYYGMRTLLVYYMIKQLLIGQERASLIYGLYTAFVYFTPIVGGLVSDRWLGRRNSVLLGGSIMALGHFMMAFEPSFYLALAAIAIGNGLFLPSLPSQINGLYAPDDPRRRTAYNYYYLGVNLGAFLAPFACGTVGELYGWHWGFTIAGVGMVIAMLTYVAGRCYLPPEPARERPARAHAHAAEESVLARFRLLFGIAAVVVVFRTAYEQIGNTLPLWIEGADRQVGAFVIPMTWFQALNPLLVFLLTPWFVARWLRLARQGREPSSIAKMVIGAGVTAFSYLMLAGVAASGDANGAPAAWLWIIAFFVVMTAGELYILPIGLGLFGRLAPLRFSATTIASWFFAAFAGNLAAGALGTLWSDLSAAQFFALTAGVAMLSAALLLFFDRATRRAASE
jgi:POT family proton-dependent oligopeptide transporter